MVTQKRRQFKIRQRQKRRAKRKTVIKYLRGHGVGKGIIAESLTDPFNDLKRIIKEGCKKLQPISDVHIKTNAYIKSTRLGPGSHLYLETSKLPQTKGDKYALEMLTRIERDLTTKRKPLKPEDPVSVRYAHPDQIKRVYIVLNPKLTGTEQERRKQFYRRELPRGLIEFVPEIPLRHPKSKR